MPDAGGRFKGITVPDLPWLRKEPCGCPEGGYCALAVGGALGPDTTCRTASGVDADGVETDAV